MEPPASVSKVAQFRLTKKPAATFIFNGYAEVPQLLMG
jgi:hypothetical protein